jgi:hypothetical protein
VTLLPVTDSASIHSASSCSTSPAWIAAPLLTSSTLSLSAAVEQPLPCCAWPVSAMALSETSMDSLSTISTSPTPTTAELDTVTVVAVVLLTAAARVPPALVCVQ